MQYYLTLGVTTAAIAVLAVALYRIRRDIGFFVGIGALYYWSLYGGWSIVTDKSGGFSGKSYHYLEHKLFPVQLDGNYLQTLLLYAGFILATELTMIVMLWQKRGWNVPKLVLRHEPVLLAGFAAAITSFLLIRGKLGAAWALNTSAYWYTRSQTDEWFTLHQVLNRVALIPPAIGIATLLAGQRSRYFISVTRRYTWPAYLILAGGMCAFTFVLGNKNEVFTALVTGVLAYAASVRRPHWGKLALTIAAGLWFLYAIDFFRATPLSSMQEVVEQRMEEATGVGRFVTSSNEAFGAHFSMYGVLAAQVEPRFGYSLYSLACSVVPRVLWPARPPDIYLYYSESVGAIQNQGYSLHHATGWYLNFGYAGVILGGVVLGLVWAGLLNAHQRIHSKTGFLFRLFATVTPWVFVAGLPPLIRAGPEGYKGILIECILIPVGTLALACRPKARKPALVWKPTAGWVWQGVR